MRVIQMSKVYLISDKKSNQWSAICYRIGIISILITIVISNVYAQLSNVKVNFELIHYAINLDVVSFSMIFSYFDSMFLYY